MIEMPIYKPVPIPTKGQPWYVWLVRIFGRRKHEIVQDWCYTLPNGTPVVIPKGFIFDGASVPRLFWFLPGLSPVGILLIPGLIHDYAYAHGYLRMTLAESIVKYGLVEKRSYWDKLFRQVGLAVNGVTIIDWVAWFCLLIGGWKAWRGHRRKDNG